MGSAPAWDGTGCEFDSWQCRMFIEPTITWVPSGFSGYIWLDTKIVLKKKKEPPVLHSLLQKVKEIWLKFTDAELVKQCGDHVIEGDTEYLYLKKCRRIIYRFVKAWEDRIYAPYDLKTGNHYDEMAENLSVLIDGVRDEDRGDRRRLLSKAYRSVSMSAELVHMFRPTYIKPKPLSEADRYAYPPVDEPTN